MNNFKFKFLTFLYFNDKMTQTITFEPEVLFPQKSEVGRQIIRAYREHAPEIEYSGHQVPGIDNPTKRLPNVKLPYQWETSSVEVTPDLSRILELNMQTPLLIDGERIALFEKLKNSGFDGKVHGYYTVDLGRAIKGDCNNPSRRFSFGSSGNPSMSLEYPIIENKGLCGIKVDLRVYKDWDKTQIGENEFKFLDVVHDFSILRKREHFLSFCDKLNNARGLGDTGQLTMFIEKMSELKTLGEYVPEEFRNDRMEKAKIDVQSLLKSFEKGDYKAKLSEEAKQQSFAEMAQKILKLSEEKKICSDEKEGLGGAIQRLSFEREIQSII